MAAKLATINAKYGEPVITTADIRERVLGWPATDPTLEAMIREKEQKAEEMQEQLETAGPRPVPPASGQPDEAELQAALAKKPRGVLVFVKNYQRRTA